MGFKEIVSSLQGCFVKKIDLPVVSRLMDNFFWEEKRFFRDGVFGFNGKDLTNAVFQRAVVAGDVVEVVMRTSGKSKVMEPFIYKSLGQNPGSHVFDLEFGDELCLDPNDILGWKKVERSVNMETSVPAHTQA